MRKIITSIVLTACVVLCAAVWLRSAEVGDLPAEAVKTAITAEIETETKEYPLPIISAENNASVPELITETEPIKQAIPATVSSHDSSHSVKLSSKPVYPSAPASAEPKPGTIAVIDGVKSMWIPGFGWVKDEGDNVGTTVGNLDGQLAVNKVGIMGDTVGSDGDINKQVGIMGGGDSHTEKATPPPQPEMPEPTGDVIYIELQPPVTKDRTPPDYKPGQ